MANNRVLAAAVAASLGMTAGAADAAVYAATLTQALTYANNAPYGSACNFSSSTSTWTYDDVSGLLTQTGGTYNLRVSTGPSTLYRTTITGLIIGNGQLAAANSYVCTEGNFGVTVGASICGNYSLGANFLDESATSWGPGTDYSRTFGGDDYAAGPQQNLDRFHGMATVSFDPGGTLVLTNKSCTGSCPPGGYNFGHQWTFGNLQLIEDADATVIATMGLKALEALHHIEPHAIDPVRDVGRARDWFGRKLVPLHHVSSLLRVTGLAPSARADLEAVRPYLRRPERPAGPGGVVEHDV